MKSTTVFNVIIKKFNSLKISINYSRYLLQTNTYKGQQMSLIIFGQDDYETSL